MDKLFTTTKIDCNKQEDENIERFYYRNKIDKYGTNLGKFFDCVEVKLRLHNLDKYEYNKSNTDFKKKDVFYRKAVYQCIDKIEKSDKKIVALVGNIKVGKSKCLQQLNEMYYHNSIYINFKERNDDDKFVQSVVDSILNCEYYLYLLDEVTSIKNLVLFLTEIDKIYSSQKNVKIVLTSSCTSSLLDCISVALVSDYSIIPISFIDFEEWLVYTGKLVNYGDYSYIPDNSDFKEYIEGTKELFGIERLDEYIKYTIDDLMWSKIKDNLAFGKYSIGYNVDYYSCITVINTALLNLNEGFGIEDFGDSSRPVDFIYSKITNKNIDKNKFKEFLDNKINIVKEKCLEMSPTKFISVVKFLMCNNLITVYEKRKLSELNHMEYHKYFLSQEYTGSIEALLDNVVICPTYPHIYVDIINLALEGLGFNEDWLTNLVYSHMFECYARNNIANIFKSKYICKFHDVIDSDEVDFINYKYKLAIGITTKNKKKNESHFDKLDDDYTCILISDSKEFTILNNRIIIIPYAVFILETSRGYLEHVVM